MAANANANASTAQFNAVATAVVNDLADGQRRIDALNEQAKRGGFAAFAAKRGFEIPRTVDESNEAEWRAKNGYESLVARAQADEEPKYRPAVARADDSPVMYRSTVARVQDHGDGHALDSVERSLQTLEAYIRTLQGHLPPTALDESLKEFKRMLNRAENALIQAHEASATPATPAPSPARPTDELGDLLKAAVDEVMAEA